MARDPLKVLWRVRDKAVMAASRDLAAAREAEAHHVGLLGEHCATMRREQEAAIGPLVAAFIEWLPHARRQADGLHRAVQTEQARVAGLQRALVVRRTEAEAVSKAISRKEAAAGQVTTRKEQAAMDEAAGRSGALRFA
ncbi:MAG: flagellar FliJ family protein [Gemmatimonadaceae bacterium]|nr:flagellar FliJ family protein [Acetobacteraceae bacterium]